MSEMDEQEIMMNGGKAATYNSQGYPKRDGAEDCSFFLKNGTCKFSSTCKFNHPELLFPGTDFNSKGFPLHAGTEDCAYYMKTLDCKYGCTCKWNHPELDSGAAPGVVPRAMQQIGGGGGGLAHMGGTTLNSHTHSTLAGLNPMGFPMRPGEPVCKFYSQNGTCKFGQTCKFDHPPSKPMGQGGSMVASAPNMAAMSNMSHDMRHDMRQSTVSAYNSLGLPLRPGHQNCAFFQKTGQCKFGSTCKFDHSQSNAVPVDATGMGIQSLPMQAGAPVAQTMMGSPAAMAGSRVTHSGGQPAAPPASEFNSMGLPIRPGVNTCAFFTKTGTCSYGSTCKWSHPESGVGGGDPTMGKSRGGTTAANELNSMGYPIRPSEKECAFFVKNGKCSFGKTCKWNHPEESVGASFGKIAGDALLRPSPY